MEEEMEEEEVALPSLLSPRAAEAEEEDMRVGEKKKKTKEKKREKGIRIF